MTCRRRIAQYDTTFSRRSNVQNSTLCVAPQSTHEFWFSEKIDSRFFGFSTREFCRLTTNQWVKRLAFDWSRHHDLLPPREMSAVARRISRLCFPALVSPRRSGTDEPRLRCAIRRSLRRQCASEGRCRCLVRSSVRHTVHGSRSSRPAPHRTSGGIGRSERAVKLDR